MKHCSNEELIELIRAGNKEALSVLVNKSKGLIYKLALENIKDKQELPDALQECWISFLRAVDLYNPNVACFSTYACCAIINKLRQLARDRQRRNSIDIRDGLEMQYLEDRNLENPEDIISRRELCTLVHNSLNALTSKQADVLLSRAEGYTLNQIGRRYNVTREAIRLIEKRALDKLRLIAGGNCTNSFCKMNKATNEEIERAKPNILNLRKQGLPIHVIASRVKLSKAIVRNYLKDCGFILKSGPQKCQKT